MKFGIIKVIFSFELQVKNSYLPTSIFANIISGDKYMEWVKIRSIISFYLMHQIQPKNIQIQAIGFN